MMRADDRHYCKRGGNSAGRDRRIIPKAGLARYQRGIFQGCAWGFHGFLRLAPHLVEPEWGLDANSQAASDRRACLDGRQIGGATVASPKAFEPNWTGC